MVCFYSCGCDLVRKEEEYVVVWGIDNDEDEVIVLFEIILLRLCWDCDFCCCCCGWWLVLFFEFVCERRLLVVGFDFKVCIILVKVDLSVRNFVFWLMVRDYCYV